MPINTPNIQSIRQLYSTNQPISQSIIQSRLLKLSANSKACTACIAVDVATCTHCLTQRKPGSNAHNELAHRASADIHWICSPDASTHCVVWSAGDSAHVRVPYSPTPPTNHSHCLNRWHVSVMQGAGRFWQLRSSNHMLPPIQSYGCHCFTTVVLENLMHSGNFSKRTREDPDGGETTMDPQIGRSLKSTLAHIVFVASKRRRLPQHKKMLDLQLPGYDPGQLSN